MSHEIEKVNGKYEIAYAGQTPWHGLGQNLTPDADIETWRVEAGLNWSAIESPVFFQGKRSELINFPKRTAIIRDDINHPLGLVTNRYKIHQPNEILDFFKTLVETAGFSLEVAGAINKGRRIWALANVNKSACVLGDDEIKAYLLLSTSFDGTKATTAQFTSVRTVCKNTLNMADNEQTKSRVSITHGSKFDASRIRNRLGIIVDGFDGMMDSFKRMAETPISTYFADEMLSKLFPATVQKGDLKTSRSYNRVMELYNGEAIGSNLPSANGTKWGLLNAVTQYIDYERGHNIDTRLANAWFGQGERLKSEALQLLDA